MAYDTGVHVPFPQTPIPLMFFEVPNSVIFAFLSKSFFQNLSFKIFLSKLITDSYRFWWHMEAPPTGGAV